MLISLMDFFKGLHYFFNYFYKENDNQYRHYFYLVSNIELELVQSPKALLNQFNFTNCDDTCRKHLDGSTY